MKGFSALNACCQLCAINQLCFEIREKKSLWFLSDSKFNWYCVIYIFDIVAIRMSCQEYDIILNYTILTHVFAFSQCVKPSQISPTDLANTSHQDTPISSIAQARFQS